MSATALALQARDLFLGWLLDGRRAGHGLAIMRMAFGGMTMLILLMSAPNFSYTFGAASLWGTALQSDSSIRSLPWPWPFPFDRTDPDWLLFLKVAVLFAVALAYTLGWRMRIVSPLFVYLWLGFSSLDPVVTNTGHYQTFRVMLLFMLFADLSQRWSLDARRRAKHGTPASRPLFDAVSWPPPTWLPNLFNNAAVIMIGFQLCVIYVTSALWKLQGSTWITGVAAYYPLRLEELRLFPWLNDLVWGMTPVVLVASWASVYLQLLFPLMLLNRWTRMIGLIGVTGMHVGIGVLLGIPFFSLVMIAGDMVFIRESSWRWLRSSAERIRDRVRRTEPATSVG